MKRKRQMKIMELINSRTIETQDELATLLNEAGFEITQATISRDIKELGLVKAATRDGSYRYSPPGGDDSMKLSARYLNILQESVVKTDYSRNIAVIKTYAGMAQAAAAAIDSMSLPQVVGTIAGDDTIMLVMRGDDDAVEFVKKVDAILNS